MGACPCFSFLPCLGGHTVSDSKCCTKQVILIRHGESLWNQMLGHGHKARLAAAGHEKRHVESRENFKRNVTRLLKPQDEDSQARLEQRIDRLGGFLRGVRGGFRKARTIAKGAKDIHRVDHGLSRTGIEQARLLGQQIHALTRTGVRRFQRSNAETALVECRHWYVSPFLRAMQTAAFALAPLCDRGKGVKIDVDPLAREIMGSKASYDCRGKEGNVGYRVILRTLRKFGEAFSEEEEEAAAAAAAAGAAAADEQACDTRAASRAKQSELSSLTNALCSMNLEAIEEQWWSDVKLLSMDHRAKEQERVRHLLEFLMDHPAPVVGVVAHSLVFQQILRLCWPLDAVSKENVCSGLRNGAGIETKDPREDKVMNCGVLVLTLSGSTRPCITAAEFLFDGKMESALAEELRTHESEDAEELTESVEEMLAFLADRSPPDSPRKSLSASSRDTSALRPPSAPPSISSAGLISEQAPRKP
eukprot:TRINITY_DN16356_c0_g2_i1.p1 TRINITY_DN16356_c0_g2~~TRINITY_DN16356_c0_g2_i1.p1  ORF type:complete len:476 (+),score=75.19 TRINITY_DN16356_c0_g2_i1:62-1489(+)